MPIGGLFHTTVYGTDVIGNPIGAYPEWKNSTLAIVPSASLALPASRFHAPPQAKKLLAFSKERNCLDGGGAPVCLEYLMFRTTSPLI